MKTKSSKYQKSDPTPQVVVSERMRQEMLAIAVRNLEAFLAIRTHLDAATMQRVSQPFAAIWKATLDYYDENNVLPDHPLLSAEVSRVIDDEYFTLSPGQLDHMNELIELVYDDSAYKKPVETSKEHSKWAIDTAQKLLVQLAAEKLKESLDDPASLLEMPALLQAMSDHVGAIASMSAAQSGDLFAAGWDVEEQKPLFPTGLDMIDKFIGGMRAAEVYGFLGPYGSCKTTVAVQAVVEAAKQCDLAYKAAMADHAQAVADWEAAGEVGPRPEAPPKPMAIYASYETPIGEFRERCLAFLARVPRKRLMEMGAAGVNSLAGPDDAPPAYEKDEYATEIGNGTIFPCERERVLTAAARLNKFVVFLDMTGKTKERESKGKGGVPELATDVRFELRERGARLYCLWLDHAASMCEEYMIEKEKDASERRTILRRIPKQLGTMIAGPLNGAVFVLQQLSGEANSRKSTANIDHTDSDECKSFGMYLDFAITCTKPTVEQVSIFRCTKHRRTPPIPHRFVRVVGEFNRVIDVSDQYTMEGGGAGIVSKALKNNVATAEEVDDIVDEYKPKGKKKKNQPLV